MIHIETDCLEELIDNLKSCISSSEEAWYGLRSVRSEILQDEILSQVSDLSNIQNYVDSSIRTSQRINDMLMDLKAVLDIMPEEMKNLEQMNQRRIEKIEAFALAYAENFQTAINIDNSNRIENPTEQMQSSLVEAALYEKAEEIQQEELAAVKRILKDNYQFVEVVHGDVENEE